MWDEEEKTDENRLWAAIRREGGSELSAVGRRLIILARVGLPLLTRLVNAPLCVPHPCGILTLSPKPYDCPKFPDKESGTEAEFLFHNDLAQS